MRVAERFLTAQLQSMLQLHASQSQTYESSRADRPATAVDEYVDLLIQKEHSQNENHVLREQLDGVHQLHQTLRVECEEEVSGRERDAVRATAASQDSGQGYIRINFMEDEAPFYYMPYTEDECAAVIRKTRRRIRQTQSNIFQ